MSIRPYFVEILGTPEAGKTSAIKEVIKSLSSKGYDVQYNQESAELLPSEFKKGSLEAHLWMKCHTIQQLLASSVSQKQIVIVDRGILDGFFWNFLLSDTGTMSYEQMIAMNTFLQKLDLMPDIAIILSIPPEEAIRRRGGEGKLVTQSFIQHFNTVLFEYLDGISIPKFCFDTTNLSKEAVAKTIEAVILENYNI